MTDRMAVTIAEAVFADAEMYKETGWPENVSTIDVMEMLLSAFTIAFQNMYAFLSATNLR